MEEKSLKGTDTFFCEKEQFFVCLDEIISGETKDEQKDFSYQNICKVLEKYHEQSSLLDPYLENIMQTLMENAKSLLFHFEKKRLQSLRETEEETYPYEVHQCPQLDRLFQVVYQLCRIRGYKVILRFFSHEVSELEPVVHLLLSQDPNHHANWTTRYTLLLWLSMLSLLPFNINTMDSGSGESGETLVTTIVGATKQYLSDPSPSRDAAAVCLSLLLTRPDMEKSVLAEFIQSASSTIKDCVASQAKEFVPSRAFLLAGTLQALAGIFKKAPRDNVATFVPSLFYSVLQLSQSNQGHRHLIVKLFQRMGLCFLQPCVATWRYQRGKRSLLENISNTKAVGKGPLQADLEVRSDDGEEEEDFDAPEELEDILDQLLQGLQDKDTVVRWSAAKGIGRITERLPEDFGDEVVHSVAELLSPTEFDGAWHGACLALGELARRGLLLPQRLSSIVPKILQALIYDERRGTTGVGSHVRDAACYVCWAFARAYSPQVMHPYVQTLASRMLSTALFDREINCRRAASAAFQENVGRQGHENFPHGIDILTTADYFTLGNRQNSFLKISLEVARYPKYRYDLIDHLWIKMLAHWDAEIRSLASHSLHNLTSLDPSYMERVVLTSILPKCLSLDLYTRHGCTLGVAELLVALSRYPYPISPETLGVVNSLVERIEKARLYRGRGGEVMRQAVCKFISGMARASVQLPIKKQLRLLTTLDENLAHPNETIQGMAIDALRDVLNTYFPVQQDKGPSERLQARTVHQYCSLLLQQDNPAATRGAAGALGALPQCQLSNSTETGRKGLQAALKSLNTASHKNHRVGPEPDVETRQRCIEGIIAICKTVGIDGSSGLLDSQVKYAFECLLLACEDYSMDKRGDVGSWCRMEALKALKELLQLVVTSNAKKCGESSTLVEGSEVVTAHYGKGVVEKVLPNGCHCLVKFEKPNFGFYYFSPSGMGILKEKTLTVCRRGNGTILIAPSIEKRMKYFNVNNSKSEEYFTSEICRLVMCTILKQLSEKLDVVRSVAGSVLQWVLFDSKPQVPYIENREILEEVFADLKHQNGILREAFNWSVPSVTFPLISRLLSVDTYHYSILSGLVVSVGGLTESVAKSSSAALLNWTQVMIQEKSMGPLNMLSASLLKLFDEYKHEDRVTVPLIKTIDLLLSNERLEFTYMKDENFGLSLLSKLKGELRKCQNVQKLLPAVNVSVGLLHFPPDTRKVAFQLTLILLGHKFPKVRKATAEQLYVKLLAYDEIIENGAAHNEVLDLLLTGHWNDDLDTARDQRSKISQLLGLSIWVEAKKQPIPCVGGTGQNKTIDSLSSYESLVHEVGY